MEKQGKRLLAVKEVAAYLQVSQTTIYRLVRRSEIPAFKIGGDWRFNLESIDAWRLNADARSNVRPLLTDARDMPAALARLGQTISRTVAPLGGCRR